MRGYDLRTGEQLWRARLPAVERRRGQATPSTARGADGPEQRL
ncbi:hypothetical protein [Sinorhizobium meliloti]|nr:hypothetical protein [Sinorhizobium meliloti]